MSRPRQKSTTDPVKRGGGNHAGARGNTRDNTRGDGAGSANGAAKKSATRERLTQAERTARSDTRMFNAAMKLISEQGANRTTLKEICEQAGYSRGLANYRFGSKQAFLQELLNYFNRGWVDNLAAYTEGKRGLDAIIAASEGLQYFLIDHSRYMRGVYTVWCESIGGENEVKSRLDHNHRRYREDVRTWIEEGIADGSVAAHADAEQFANLYCSFVFGTVFQWLANPKAVDLPRFFDYFRGIIRNELSPPVMAPAPTAGAATSENAGSRARRGQPPRQS